MMRLRFLPILLLLLTGCQPGLTQTAKPDIMTATQVSAAPVTTLTPTEQVPTPTAPPNICGEIESAPFEGFARPYTTENSALKSNVIRTLTMGENGLWIGYAIGAGIGHFDGMYWRFCRELPHVNAIALDQQGNPWVGTDAQPSENALVHYDGKTWADLTTSLPDYRVYDLTYHGSELYVATWEGVAKFNGEEWTVPYSQPNIFGNHIHAVEFARNGDVWLGAVMGISTWHVSSGVYRPLATAEMNTATAVLELTTERIRQITQHPTNPEIWIAGDGGDVVVYNYEQDMWSRLSVPDDNITDLQFDHFGRAWIATVSGVYYFENGNWRPMPYPYAALSVAFGCEGCTFGPNEVFIATNGFGLIHASLPPVLK